MVYLSYYQQMKHLQDTEDPHQSINAAYHEPANSGRHESNLSDHLPSSENNNSSQHQQQTPTTTRKIEASSRITLNRILTQQNGSAPNATLASTDGGADEPLENHQVIVPVETVIGANSPPRNNAAQLNQFTIVHREATIQFNSNILELSSF